MNLWLNEAEISVIGACMVSEAALSDAVRLLEPRDFFGALNRRVFKLFREFYDAGVAVDLVTVVPKIRNGADGEDAYLEAESYLIQCIEYLVTPANIEHYCRVVKRWSMARDAYASAKGVMEAAVNDPDADAILEAAARMREFDASEKAHGFEEWDEIVIGKRETGVTTTWPLLDKLTAGVGFVDGQCSYWCARTKGGKTTMMVTILRRLAGLGIPCVYATFADLSPTQLKRRVVKNSCGVGGVSPDAWLTEIFEDELKSQNERFRGLISVYNAAKGGRTVEDLAAACRARMHKHPFRILFVDYIQRIDTREKGTKLEKMELVSHKLKDLAEDLGIPLVVGSQLTKREDGSWVTKHATAIAEDAGLIMFIKREKGERKATIECNLSRFGPDGIEFEFEFDDRKIAFDLPPQTHIPVELCHEE